MTTTALVLTPRSAGAIAVVQLSGTAAWATLSPLVNIPPVPPLTPRRARFTYRQNPIDDGLIIHTDPETFELHLHGGVAVVDALLAALVELGATIIDAPPPAITLEDEVAATLPLALTATGIHLLANQPATLRAWRTAALAQLEAGTWQLTSSIQWLLQRSATLAFLLTPPRVAVIGPPNAGKSTLANALLGRTVAITSDIPGTTRDWIDATTTFITETASGKVEVPITLVDTAGIRPTPDAIESESIRRTHEQLGLADAAVIVFDASAAADSSLLAGIAPQLPTVIALNKSDLAAQAPPAASGPPVVSISALHHRNLPALMAAVLTQLDLAEISLTEPFAFTPRLQNLLRRAALAPTPLAAQELLALI